MRPLCVGNGPVLARRAVLFSVHRIYLEPLGPRAPTVDAGFFAAVGPYYAGEELPGMSMINYRAPSELFPIRCRARPRLTKFPIHLSRAAGRPCGGGGTSCVLPRSMDGAAVYAATVMGDGLWPTDTRLE